jgi:hypothetical protein
VMCLDVCRAPSSAGVRPPILAPPREPRADVTGSEDRTRATQPGHASLPPRSEPCAEVTGSEDRTRATPTPGPGACDQRRPGQSLRALGRRPMPSPTPGWPGQSLRALGRRPQPSPTPGWPGQSLRALGRRPQLRLWVPLALPVLRCAGDTGKASATQRKAGKGDILLFHAEKAAHSTFPCEKPS